MGFYQKQPVDGKKLSAVYLWRGLDIPGLLTITAEGEAPNYTSGIQLERDPRFVGGLTVDVMGWTGPLGKGTAPYRVQRSFPSVYYPVVFVSGSNGTFKVAVREIPFEEVDDYVKANAVSSPR